MRPFSTCTRSFPSLVRVLKSTFVFSSPNCRVSKLSAVNADPADVTMMSHPGVHTAIATSTQESIQTVHATWTSPMNALCFLCQDCLPLLVSVCIKPTTMFNCSRVKCFFCMIPKLAYSCKCGDLLVHGQVFQSRCTVIE